MGYYQRYITTDPRDITLPILAVALRQIDEAYTLTTSPLDDLADLIHGDVLCGQIEINRRGDDLFDEDIADLQELVEGSGGAHELRVLDTLANAQTMVAVEATWDGDNSESVLSKLDPLWNWLFKNRPGLLQADNDGFYDHDELILELNLKI